MSRRMDPDKVFRQGARGTGPALRSKDGGPIIDDIKITPEQAAEFEAIMKDRWKPREQQQPRDGRTK